MHAHLSTGSSRMDIDTLARNFELLGDWDQRYEYLSDIGTKLGVLENEQRTDATKVHGCMSNVYIIAEPAGADGKIRFRAECDTAIIAGVIAILLKVYNGHTPEEAIALDADELFAKLDLFDHLSPTRHVGVYAIVERMRAAAREVMEPAARK
jgi:cysteine desulfuration protein SufE